MTRLVQTAIQEYRVFNAQTKADIEAAMALERKDELGCNDVECATEIGGALNVPYVLTGLSKAESYLVTLKLTETAA